MGPVEEVGVGAVEGTKDGVFITGGFIIPVPPPPQSVIVKNTKIIEITIKPK